MRTCCRHYSGGRLSTTVTKTRATIDVLAAPTPDDPEESVRPSIVDAGAITIRTDLRDCEK